MVRQVAPRFGEPRLWDLDHRVADLEAHVAQLTEAVELLKRELAARRGDEPADTAGPHPGGDA